MGLHVQSELATLTKQLQETMLNASAFDKAVAMGYIVMAEDGQHLVWALGNNALLAYFCGKLWCGDKGVFSRRKQAMLWSPGKLMFPAAQLNRTFGVTTLKQIRIKRKNLTLPRCFQLVDNLFDM